MVDTSNRALIFIMTILIAALATSGFIYAYREFFTRGPVDLTVKEFSEAATNRNPTKPEVEKYIRDNIGILADKEEVLGGNFYVTEIEFTGDRGVIVDYEDGHMAWRAELEYSLGSDGKVMIDSFITVEENPAPKNVKPISEKEEPLIGGQRDEHGCLGPAGYAWIEEINACGRTWELDDEARRAVKAAVNYIGAVQGLTVVEVKAQKEAGDFIITLEKGLDDTKTRINIETASFEVIGEPEVLDMADTGIIESEDGLNDAVCTRAGGNWNECSSKCQLDNQGQEGVACTMMCEQLCECAGLKGFNCPEGYECVVKADNKVADALGYCAPIE